MPSKGQRKSGCGRGRKAAELYLRALAEGDSLTVDQVAERFGISRVTVHNEMVALRGAARARG